MQKKPILSSAANGKHSTSPPMGSDWEEVLRQRRAEAGLGPPQERSRSVSVLGRPALLRHRALGRRTLPVAAMIVGTYAVDERYVIVQAFPIGSQPVQFADVQLVDDDPGETNDAVVWLVT
jgi:hypothetical protein